MTGQSKKTLTPKLRFPKFKDAPGWEGHTLGAIVSVSKGKGVAKADVTENGKTPCIRYAELYTIYGEVIRTVHSRTNIPVDELVLSEAGDVIIPASGETKEDIATCACVLEAGVALGGDLNVLRSGIDGQFFSYYLNGRKRAELAKMAQGDTVVHLYPSQISRLTIHFPSDAAEQQRIAACLTSLDEVLSAEGRKLEALRAHKKGLMQQLFPRPGESRPRIRFPEFQGAGEWEERKAGTLFADRKTKGEDGLPIYSVTINDGMVRRDSFERDFGDIEDAAGNKKAYRNDIAYNVMRMWQGACGVAPEDCLVSPAYVVLSPLEGVHSVFFEHFFKLPTSLPLLESYSRGLTKDRLRLYFEDFAKMPLLVPGEAEQQRIADCLSSLDALIAAASRKRDSLRAHKKGLMQQLFPSPEGV